MADTHETIADIIAEKRRRADKIERDVAEKMKRGEMVSDCYARELVADIRREADRFDAAHKRERAKIEADALAVGGIVEAARKSELSKNASKNWADFGQLGDAAKLRGVLETLRELLGDLLRLGDAEYHDDFSNFCNIIDAALAAPPRNCDVGTAEEQHARFVSYCDRCDCPMGCDHRKNFVGVLKPECASILTCFIRWAQMPYEEGGDR